MLKRLFLSFLSLVLVTSVLKAQSRSKSKRSATDSGYSIVDSSFKSSLEYQKFLKNGCSTHRVNVTCPELLSLWQQALPSKQFTRIEDVEKYLLEGAQDVKCRPYKMDVGGIALPSRKVGFKPKILDTKEMCVEDLNTHQIVAILKCGNPTRPLGTKSQPAVQSPVDYSAIRDSLRLCTISMEKLTDSLHRLENRYAELANTAAQLRLKPSKVDTILKERGSRELVLTSLLSAAGGFVGGYYTPHRSNVVTQTIIRGNASLSPLEERIRQSRAVGVRFTLPIGR